MDFDEDSALALCSPLQNYPLKSHNTKKVCNDSKEKETVSYADVLKAIQELTSRFTFVEQKLSKNTIYILSIKKNVEGIEF